MELILTPKAEDDLDSLKDAGESKRIAKKIDEIEEKLDQGFDPELVIEKRTRGGWNPILQQRIGDYRLWFVEGGKTEAGNEDEIYLIRVLTKNQAVKMKGLEINPDIYL